ncbi:hypothetical protein Plhal304r1_c007g0028921 [Plasmopara halstedii]
MLRSKAASYLGRSKFFALGQSRLSGQCLQQLLHSTWSAAKTPMKPHYVNCLGFGFRCWVSAAQQIFVQSGIPRYPTGHAT